jgi:hypothetical protein
MRTLSKSLWNDPPWGSGDRKYRLGLKPVNADQWLDREISNDLFQHKKNLFESNYNKVVATTEDSEEAQKFLGTFFGIDDSDYPDLIAEMSLNIQDDLCLIESKGEQRLIAACICSPSYWDVRTKIGKPLNEIHGPVTSLEEKIGNRISTFIKQAPVMKPFARQNWLIHGDTNRFHLKEEEPLKTHPSEWFIRSEKETLCRFHEDYSLFTINVLFEPLKEIFEYPKQKLALIKSLEKLDNDEADYFGGNEKINILLDYLLGQV